MTSAADAAPDSTGVADVSAGLDARAFGDASKQPDATTRPDANTFHAGDEASAIDTSAADAGAQVASPEAAPIDVAPPDVTVIVIQQDGGSIEEGGISDALWDDAAFDEAKFPQWFDPACGAPDACNAGCSPQGIGVFPEPCEHPHFFTTGCLPVPDSTSPCGGCYIENDSGFMVISSAPPYTLDGLTLCTVDGGLVGTCDTPPVCP